MKKFAPPYFLILLIFFTSPSCSLRPIYGKSHAYSDEANDFLSQLELRPINSIAGAEFMDEITRLLPKSGDAKAEKKYILDVTLTFDDDYSIMLKNSDILRSKVGLNVSYVITEIGVEKKIQSGGFYSIASYNSTFSPYSSLLLRQEIYNNASIDAARTLIRRIVLNLGKKKDETHLN